jgi:hypothetical protein
VHAALREDGCLESVQLASYLLILPRPDKTILEHAAKFHVGAFDEDQELYGPRVNVGCIDATRRERDDCHADIEASGERVGSEVLYRRMGQGFGVLRKMGGILTAALEEPPNAPRAGWSPSKSKTMSFSSSSPVRSVSPSTSSSRARSRAVGAD